MVNDPHNIKLPLVFGPLSPTRTYNKQKQIEINQKKKEISNRKKHVQVFLWKLSSEKKPKENTI
jgi:hypothetical protein